MWILKKELEMDCDLISWFENWDSFLNLILKF